MSTEDNSQEQWDQEQAILKPDKPSSAAYHLLAMQPK